MIDADGNDAIVGAANVDVGDVAVSL